MFWQIQQQENKEKNKEKNNFVTYKIIKSLSDDNDKCYIELDRDTNTFQIKEDPYQQEKDEIYQIIFTVENELARSVNKKNKKLPKIKKVLKGKKKKIQVKLLQMLTELLYNIND